MELDDRLQQVAHLADVVRNYAARSTALQTIFGSDRKAVEEVDRLRAECLAILQQDRESVEGHGRFPRLQLSRQQVEEEALLRHYADLLTSLRTLSSGGEYARIIDGCLSECWERYLMLRDQEPRR